MGRSWLQDKQEPDENADDVTICLTSADALKQHPSYDSTDACSREPCLEAGPVDEPADQLTALSTGFTVFKTVVGADMLLVKLT